MKKLYVLFFLLLAGEIYLYKNYNPSFNGIARVPRCSGSLIKFDGSSKKDLGIVLTNGHCRPEGFPRANQFFANYETQAIVRLYTGWSYNTEEFLADRVIYSTMTGTDITLFQLDSTYEEIEKRGITPLTLSSKEPSIGTKISIISGYWKTKYSCAIEKVVEVLREGPYKMQNSLRYSRPGCQVIHGTSGSPVLEQGTRNVIGINNTGNDDGEKCIMDNPCETDNKGSNIIWQKGYSYAQQTALIYSCVKNGAFNLKTPGCKLFH